MQAFHNDAAIKEKYLERVRLHRAADEIIKGKYWENGKGCAVGCTIHSGEHASYEVELGIPRVLARLEDGIFEALPNDLAMTWPERFLDVITPGVDLSQVHKHFFIWLLSDPTDGVIKFANADRTKQSIQNVTNLYLRSLKEEVAVTEWRAYAAAYAAYAVAAAAAAYAAYAAAAAAAYAAYAAAADAAYAAYAANAAAADAADAAAYAYAYAYAADADARTKAIIRQSEKLLELLREAK